MPAAKSDRVLCSNCGGDGRADAEMWIPHRSSPVYTQVRCELCAGDGYAACDNCGDHALKRWTLINDKTTFYYCSLDCQREDHS